jgi:predicted AAA+ superfamily ATPase
MIKRAADEQSLRDALARAPVVVLTGPRQAGKSTLARTVVALSPEATFDLEDPRDLARLAQPMLALEQLAGPVVIDEAQRLPELFRVLRVLVDADRRTGRFLVLGSASPDLIGLAAESLAGRVALLELGGFSLRDVGPEALDSLWLRGGLPLAFLADDTSSLAWRDDYVTTFLERDLGNLGIRVPATTMRRFWTMVAHYHGQQWSGAELARSLSVSEPTIRRYLDALTDALVIRQLPPWFANVGKRQVRSPKVYVRDSGLLHALLGISDRRGLERHPKLGASWEGFVVEQLLNVYPSRDPSYWRTHAGAELDLRLELDGGVIGVEVKRTDRPSITPSIRSALADLELDRLVVVHAGTHRFELAERVTAVPAAEALAGGLLTPLAPPPGGSAGAPRP